MKKSIFIIFLTYQIFAGSVQANTIEQELNCVRPGYNCDGLRTSYFCQVEEDGIYSSTRIEDCSEGEGVCLRETGRCIRPEDIKPSQNDEEYKFKCQQAGMFPHPFECNRYFICAKDESGNYASKDYRCAGPPYNYKTGLCKTGSLSCKYTPICERLGETGRVGDHDSMYYVCLPVDGAGLHAQMFTCPADMLFIDGKCSRPERGLDDDGKCKEVGDFQLKGGCRNYNSCEAVGEEPRVIRCGCSAWFDPVKKTCRSIPCQEDYRPTSSYFD